MSPSAKLLPAAMCRDALANRIRQSLERDASPAALKPTDAAALLQALALHDMAISLDNISNWCSEHWAAVKTSEV